MVLEPAVIKNEFGLNSDVISTEPYGEGHINTTYLVVTLEGKRYILQRINTDTFKDPVALMENINGITAYMRELLEKNGGDVERGTLNFLPTRFGNGLYFDTEGGAWRMCPFVEDTICLQQAETPEQFKLVGTAFGTFQNELTGFDASRLHETIPHFHDTPERFRNFEKAVEADSCGRAEDVQKEIEFVRSRKKDCHVLVDRLAAGILPLRVTHNDTKMNNILLDCRTGEGVCVIDLDTVMPGLAACDFGDTIRFGANNCAEDEQDQSKVSFSIPLYRAFTEGFLGAAPSLTAEEKRSMPWGARLMTLECGMRFLTDYLEGDHYFHTERPGQNLDRARTQFCLVKQMEDKWEELNKEIDRYID